jgi:hypothetical protein
MKKLIVVLALMVSCNAQANEKDNLCAMLTTHAAQIVVYERYCGVQGYMLGRTTERMTVVDCPNPTEEMRNEAYRREQLSLDDLLHDMPNFCKSALAKDVIGY